MTDERIRVSDADRERAAARLREHFAQGRLSSEELDERIAAALSAKTAGDVRRIMAGLPDPVPVPPPARRSPPWATGRRAAHRGRPRIVPLAVFALIAALVIPGAGWLFLAFLQLVMVFWLAACLAGIFAASRFRRNASRSTGPAWAPRSPYGAVRVTTSSENN